MPQRRSRYCRVRGSYNRLGKDAEEADAEEILDMASKASLADQQKQVQENVHSQLKTFSMLMDEILLPDAKTFDAHVDSPMQAHRPPLRSGLSYAVGSASSLPPNHSTVPQTKPLKLSEVSNSLKHHLGFSLALRPSQIAHKDAGQGLFLEGEADVGSVIAIYPGVVHSPTYYRYIPGYPRVDARNSYLITRYDGAVINAQPWGVGGDTREPWDGTKTPVVNSSPSDIPATGSDRMWRMLSKPLEETTRSGTRSDILERRNPLAFAHFANHPASGSSPNVMVCQYDFPLTETTMRAYIPNVMFGNEAGVKMRRLGSFWFKSWGSDSGGGGCLDAPVVKSVVLVATRTLCDEEVLLNYRLSNSKRRPEWYTPVDEEEDRRRWG